VVLVGVVAAGIALAVSRSPHRVRRLEHAAPGEGPGGARFGRSTGPEYAHNRPCSHNDDGAVDPRTDHLSAPPRSGLGFAEGQVTAVGDSVMLDYQTPLQQAVPGINVEAAVSRQWSDGETILQQLKAAGQLGAVVIVGLGTNGPITDADFDAIDDHPLGRFAGGLSSRSTSIVHGRTRTTAYSPPG